MNDLARRALDLGIERDYFDARGVHRTVSDETLERLVAALTDAAGETPQQSALIWRRGVTQTLPIAGISEGAPWRLFSGETQIAGGALAGGDFHLPPHTPPGHYRLDLEGHGTFPLIVAPHTAYQLDDVAPARIWVLAVQLYAVRSRRNWGIGDFTDLASLVQIAGAAGAAGIGLNPLHALFDDRPQQASPYSPNSRLFLNTLYIDPEAIPEFPGLAKSGLAEEVARLRDTALVDYAAVARVKTTALRSAFARFQRSRSVLRRKRFAEFRAERGEALTRFAAFEVLRRRFQEVWWNWPEPWRWPTQEQLAELRAEADDEMTYYEYVQWVADEQLAACADAARALGLPIGLYLDVAVGVEPGGADAWSGQASLIPQVEVGAPPDLLNTAGQAWGLAAFNPRALEAAAFLPFAELIKSVMRHAGAIRLDHVLGLNRFYLIPFGLGAKDGAYVRYPLQGLLATAASESVRHRCLVIGEDLGTVPAELRDTLADWGVWSYLVMLFERHADGTFKHPHEYRRNALVTFSTHDLPAFAGWLSGHDLTVKREVGIDPGESDGDREDARALLRSVLEECALGREPTFEAVTRFLARSPSRLLVVAIDDILGVEDQPNVPGTLHEHPNWQRRLPLALEDFAASPELARIAEVLREEHRAAG